MKRTILILLTLSIPALSANANDLWLDVNVASYHSGADSYCYNGKCDSFNQANYGLGLSYEMNDTFEVTGGFFKNSYSKHSNYAGIKTKHDFTKGNWSVTPGLTLGLVTGYDNTEVEAPMVMPMALPTVSVRYKRVRGTVGYLPFTLISEESKTDVLTFQVGLGF